MTLRVITLGWSTSKVYLVLEKPRTILSKIVSERIVWLWLRSNPKGWTNAPKLEKILLASPGPHLCSEVFRFCKNSKR